MVTGAYKATPIHVLETKAWVLPLDLYLNKRLADFEARIRKLALLGGRRLVDIVNGAYARLYRRFRKPRGRRGLLGRQGLQGLMEVERRAAEALQ